MVSEEKIVLGIDQRETRLSMAAMFVNGPGQISKFYRGHSIDASYQVAVHLA